MKKSVLITIFIMLIMVPTLVLAGGKKDDKVNNNNNINNQTSITEPEKYEDCTSLLGDPDGNNTPAFYLVKVFEVIKYAAIILLIVLTIFDFIGAVSSQDNDAIIKATKKAGLRLILCIIIFLLPTIIKFVLKYLSDRATDLCGIG